MDILLRSWGLHIENYFDLLGVDLDASHCHHKAKKLFRRDIEDVLYRVQFHVIPPQGIKCFSQIVDMESSFLALHEYVIDVDLHISIDLIFEDFVD